MASHEFKGKQQEERVKEILRLLANGKRRDEIAKTYRYSTWKSLDIYMRRHGFIWNSLNNTYVINSTSTETDPQGFSRVDEISPMEIVKLFNTKLLDPREIAKKIGFSDHKEMAAYMLRHNYVWSSKLQNYINTRSEEASEAAGNLDRNLPASSANFDESHLSGRSDLEKYGPLLEFLFQNKEKLLKILESVDYNKQIRIYTVQGAAKTKSIFLTDALCELMNEFCSNHSLTQKQGYESAIIEYLSKYGERDAVNKLLLN